MQVKHRTNDYCLINNKSLFTYIAFFQFYTINFNFQLHFNCVDFMCVMCIFTSNVDKNVKIIKL